MKVLGIVLPNRKVKSDEYTVFAPRTCPDCHMAHGKKAFKKYPKEQNKTTHEKRKDNDEWEEEV